MPSELALDLDACAEDIMSQLAEIVAFVRVIG
jgi:hypothetical protein